MGAFFVEFALVGKRKDLIAATVGQDGSVPAHEGMQTACFLQDVHSRAQIEMIGVAQDDPGVNVVFQFTLMHGFDTAHSAHRHKDGRRYAAVMVWTISFSCPALGPVPELKPHRPNFTKIHTRSFLLSGA